MHLQIKIQDEKFSVSVGKGFNDWVWLAHYCARIYSKNIYPQGTYLPTVLYLQNSHKHIDYNPHPREKIFEYLQTYTIHPEQIVVVIKVRKANHSYTQYEKSWQRQAYQKEQYLITFSFHYLANNHNRKKDFMLKVKTQYSMSDEVKHFFNEKDYPPQMQTLLIIKPIGPNQSKFEATLQVPQGSATHRLFYYQRESIHDDYTETQLSEKKLKKQDFIIREQPIYVPHQKILTLIQNSMKIEEDINKTLQQKQLQTKKRNASSSLCCYTFEQLWTIITTSYAEELSLSQYEPSTIQRIKLTLEKFLNELYEIFFYYFILENQQKDKKQELGIIYQDVMHFLRDYGVLNDMINLTNFFQFYNADESKFKKVEDTLDINNHPIKFTQFVVILLRSIQFVQTSTFLMKGETYDTATSKIFEKIVEIDSDINQFTEFKRNLRENPKIISFVRSHSQKLKNIYKWMVKKSIKLSSNSFSIEKQQFKQLLISSSLAENNTDKIVGQCFKELKLNDQIFYYEFLMAVEWLSMAIIQDEKEDEIQNQDEQALMIVEKMKYFLEKIQLE